MQQALDAAAGADPVPGATAAQQPGSQQSSSWHCGQQVQAAGGAAAAVGCGRTLPQAAHRNSNGIQLCFMVVVGREGAAAAADAGGGERTQRRWEIATLLRAACRRRSLGGMGKLLLGVVHLPALPSAPGHRDMATVLEHGLADARALRDGGVDGVVVENFGDVPFHKGTAADPVPPDVPAALALCAHRIGGETGLPVAINCLRNDGRAAMAAATVAGARWIRVNVWSGACATDQGVIEGEAAAVLRYRKQLGSDVRVLADLLVKHASPLVPTDAGSAARDLAERSGADGLILTGDRTGAPVDAALLQQVRAAVGGFPIWIGSGLSPANAAELWPRCDGAIVGTWLKQDGRIDAPVDVERVRALRRLCR